MFGTMRLLRGKEAHDHRMVQTPPLVAARWWAHGLVVRSGSLPSGASFSELLVPGQSGLRRIRPARVLVRNLLSSCSHGAESTEAAWGGRRPERKLIARDDGHPMARDGPERPEGCQGRPVLPYGENATLPRLKARSPRRTYAARAGPLLDGYRKRRSCSGGSNSIDPCQLWHAAKSSFFARAFHFGQCRLPSWQACPSGDSEDFQHVLVLISRRSDPFRESRRAGKPGSGKDRRINLPQEHLVLL